MSLEAPSKMTVIKCGGAVAGQSAEAVLALAASGEKVCVVHGAGPQISRELERRGIPAEFVRGRRLTSPAALEIVRSCLVAVNGALCATLGPLAVGLIGDEIGLDAQPLPELGLVGDPLPSRPAAVIDALERGYIPVVAPLARGPLGALNVNADEAAAALAIGLGASRILFLTDVPGVLRDGSSLRSIGADEAETLLDDGSFQGGIVPKLRAAIRAARGGVDARIGETAVLA